jgi:hypothetical protein
MTDGETKKVAELAALILAVSAGAPRKRNGWTNEMAQALARFMPLSEADMLARIGIGLALDIASDDDKTLVAIGFLELLGTLLGRAHIAGPKSATETLRYVAAYLERRDAPDYPPVNAMPPAASGSN